MPLLYNAYAAKLLNVLGDLPLLKKNGLFLGVTSPHTHTSLFSQATCPHTLIVVYFQGDQPTHTQSGLFSGATSPYTHTGLFSWATCPHTLKVVYFHRRPAHTRSQWSIFKGDQLTHTQSGLFSRTTSPHTHTGLFSRATCPHILKVVYFQGRLALLIGFTWDPIWRSNKNQNRCVARSTWNPI